MKERVKLYDMAKSQYTLDLGSLKAAVQALAESVEITHSPSFAGLPEAWRNTLIAGVVQSFEFSELRNITAHTYSRAKALRVAAGAPALLEQVRTMLAELERRNAPPGSS